jgi:hypothetical protein
MDFWKDLYAVVWLILGVTVLMTYLVALTPSRHTSTISLWQRSETGSRMVL